VDRSTSPLVRERTSVEYISLVSHVLMTPLAGIVLWCDMLRAKGELPDFVDRGLTAIDHSARAQVAILDNLVELSRWQERSTELHRTRTSLVPCLRDVIACSSSAAKQRGIVIRFEPPARDSAVEGDPVRIRTALRNILDNAVNASPPKGNVDVTLEASGDRAVIEIADEGGGISPEALTELFELAALTDREISRRRGGLGLGLPIARWIIELHGGTLTGRSRQPRGSVFAISWPRA
jgi:signal transduction histidine kinase